MTDGLLIILVRNPVLGQVKTRLAATLGDQKALEIYRKLLAHTTRITENLAVDKAVFYSDYVENEDQWDNDTYLKQPQSEGDLGARIGSAFQWGFGQGYRYICIIGSDCYELTTSIIEEGFEALTRYQAVLGPSRDGGYYLLGLDEFHPELFRDKSWGSHKVASETVSDFNSLDLSYSLLRPLNDIDVEADLDDIEWQV